eukprot:sb/3474120/
MTHLTLSQNFLQSLPRNLGNLRKLEILKATRNRIAAIPETIGRDRVERESKVNESEAAYESDSGTEEDAPATNYRESKIMFEHVKLGDGGGGLLRHPTPTPKQLNKMKNQRASWLNAQQEGAAAADLTDLPLTPLLLKMLKC